MKKNIIFGSLLASVALLAAQTGFAQEEAPAAPPNVEAEIRAANDGFYVALNAMFVGEMAPMTKVWSHRDDVTLMSPFGGRLVGWDSVGAEFTREAGLKFGGRVVCKDLLVRTAGDMGYAVCVEEGENMSTDGKPVIVSFRATNIFRLEDGKWKLVHHHTDVSQALLKATFEEKAK